MIIFGPKFVHVGIKLHLLSLGMISLYSFGFCMIFIGLGLCLHGLTGDG